jgi:SAM-dependent methyltransferase
MNEHDPRTSADVDEMLAAAYALDGPRANRALYERWAATYETGFVVQSGYRYHEHVARVFAERCLVAVGPDDAVVDVGCGTGLGGQALRRHALVAIDGIDISPEMSEQAAAKHVDGVPVYRRLVEADLTGSLAIADHTYAGALSVGTFTHGHVGPGALPELIRIVRPGGRLAIGINAAHYASAGFAAVLDDLAASGRIVDLDLVDVPIYADGDVVPDGADPDDIAHVAVFTVA